MSSPSMLTLPVIRQPATRSFIRLRVLMQVDLPQPEGPINAVIWFSAISMVMPLSAWKSP